MLKTRQYLAFISAVSLMTFSSTAVFAKPTLQDRVSQLERTLSASTKAQVELTQHLDSIQDEINELRGISEEQNYKINQILERQRQLYQELETRITAASQQPVATAQVSTNDDVEYASSLSENEAYEKAVNLVLKDKQYDKAIPEFNSFITSFPNSVYVPNAHYWLGQLLFNNNELDKAAENFELLVTKYTDSSKRSDALLKLGMVAQKKNDTNKAKERYQTLLKEYPDSAAARLAKKRLDTLIK